MNNPKLQHATHALQAVLQQLVGQHSTMLELLERKRVAIRSHDTRAMTELCQLENECVKAISELEKTRLELVANMTLIVKPDAAEPMRMAEMAEHLPEPARGQLLVQRQQMLDKMQQVQAETQVVRQATDAIMKHMTNLVQTVTAFSSGVTTYSAQGAPPQAKGRVSTFAVTA